ncbi:MAG: M16 family metallopeptidase, partial [Acidimicrobiia bacterium]
MNAFTTKEYTAYYVRVLDEHLDLALDILSDVVWSPSFRSDEVESERQVILEEIRMHEDSPDELAHSLFSEVMFPGHPLGREILGDVATIEAMDRDAIAAFHQEHYQSTNLVVAAAGRLDHERVVKAVADRFAGREGTRPPRRLDEQLTGVGTRVLTRPTEQAHVVLGVPSVPRGDPDRYALSVLNQVLGGGMSSRLFQEIRERRGLAYSVYSFRQAFEDGGVFAVYVGTAPGRAKEVLGLVHAELNRLVADRCVTQAELERAKGHLKGELALSLEGSASRMERLGRSQLTFAEIPSLDEVVGRIDLVTPDDVARVIDRVLTGAPRSLAVVGPFDPEDFENREVDSRKAESAG